MNKRGIFFTMISVFVVSILLVLVSSQSFVTLKDEIPVTKTRVQIANSYVNNLEDVYLSRVIRSSGYRALYALTVYMNWTLNDFLFDKYDMENYFREILINGTVDGSPVTLQGVELMKDYNLTFRLLQIENVSFDVYNINTTFDKDYGRLNASTVLFQSNDTGPWNVGVNITFNYTVNATVASWNKIKTIPVKVPIQGLDDPFYFVNALMDGRPETQYTNKILQTNIKQWNATRLREFVNKSAYRHSEYAPNFLMRLYNNNTNSSCCGIESSINPALLQINTINRDDSSLQKSYTDWCFYGLRCPPDPPIEGSIGGSFWNITGVTNYTIGGYNYAFKLDTTSVLRYNVTDWANNTYCDPAIPC
jgi:hypothetical protein